MDWVIDTASPTAVDAVSEAVVGQLRRREARLGSADLAGDSVAGAIRSVAADAASMWVRLVWEGAEPVLTVRPSRRHIERPARAAVLAPGVWAPDEETSWLGEHLDGASMLRLVLPVTRSAEYPVRVPDYAVRAPEGAGLYAEAIATALAGRDDAGISTEQACVAIGMAAGGAAVDRWAAGHGGAMPTTAGQAADAFCSFINEAGADFFVAEDTGSRAVVVNRACPLHLPAGSPAALCHCTSALAGSIGARAAGAALVHLDETIAAGDDRCRAVIDLDASPSPFGRRYQWPVVAGAPEPGSSESTVQFRVELSLQLPRDRQSVSLTRHLIRRALDEIGVRSSDADDVELAVTEATANVINHARGTDDYQVICSVGPELAEIRVVDTGHGFDYESLGGLPASPDSEQGRGVTLMQALVDQARFVSSPERGTIVHLLKRLHLDNPPPGWLHPPGDGQAPAGSAGHGDQLGE